MNLPTQWTSHSTAQSVTAPREAAVWQCPPSDGSPVRETEIYLSCFILILHVLWRGLFCDNDQLIKIKYMPFINYLSNKYLFYLYIQFILYFNEFYTQKINNKIKTNKQIKIKYYL